MSIKATVSRTLSGPEKLAALRAAMARVGVDGYIIPRTDRYMGEFVAPDAERLAWLTGFTGSAGTAVVLADKACVFSDGRYTIQLHQQIDKALYLTEDNTQIPVSQWLATHASAGAVIGFDPWLMTPAQHTSLMKAMAEKSISLKPIEGNLLDPLWVGRPPAPSSDVMPFPAAVAGLSATEKKNRIQRIIKDKNLFAVILNMPDSLCWLLNIRGTDIETTPVALSMGIVPASQDQPIDWFIEAHRVSGTVRSQVDPVARLFSPDQMTARIDDLVASAVKAVQPIGLDYARAPLWFLERLRSKGAEVVDCKDPCILPRAVKTPSEQAALRAAHVSDGVALVRFMYWLEQSQKSNLDELQIEDQLEALRRMDPAYQGPSFATIAGWNANGAIVHYRATPATNARIMPPGLLLLDSGGQYHYGTTDITRTMALGEPSPEMRRHYTLVLKGHIAVTSAVFDHGTTGVAIDALARAPLKAEGLDYAHGTGHGVGCYLSVHEESASLSARGTEPLLPGMLLSNEPGYYRAGAYGIRIENLVLVVPSADKLGFETITLVPYDRRLIDVEMLSHDERQWVDGYHAQVLRMLAPKLEAGPRTYLETACKPL